MPSRVRVLSQGTEDSLAQDLSWVQFLKAQKWGGQKILALRENLQTFASTLVFHQEETETYIWEEICPQLYRDSAIPCTFNLGQCPQKDPCF